MWDSMPEQPKINTYFVAGELYECSNEYKERLHMVLSVELMPPYTGGIIDGMRGIQVNWIRIPSGTPDSSFYLDSLLGIAHAKSQWRRVT